MNFKFWRRSRREKELDEEIQTHLRMAAREHMERGQGRADAESAARREIGNEGLIKDATREAWGLGWMERLRQDLRYGMRVLWKNPVYAVVSVFTLALGIGASTAIFSVVYGVLLHSLPYDKPDQIVRVWEVDSHGNQLAFADPNFDDIRDQARSLQGMVEFGSGEETVTVGDQPDRIVVASVSKDFFAVMGIAPVLGRIFASEDQHFGAAQAALVSYGFWQQHLHQAADLSTVKLSVSKIPVSVIGVLPPGFHFPEDSQIWMPREVEVHLPSRSAHNWRAIARLRDGASLSEARTEISGIARRIQQQYGPNDITMVDAAVLPLREALTTQVKPALLVVLGVAGLLLLVACANVMNLSLAQASARAGELAVRTALGASRWRLIRQFLAEALLLCGLGGCLGILAARFGVRLLLALAPSNIPRLDEISVNLPVLLFALGLTVLVAGGLGTFTAVRATAGEARTGLAEGGRGQGVGIRSQRTGRMIVAGQVAITLTLLVGAGLLGRSMLRVLSIYPGFQTEHVATLDLQLSRPADGMERQRAQFLDQLISRL
ncbi:MAG TPA: ABC transporter permease, partial [Candidatus Angelobacter sp.]